MDVATQSVSVSISGASIPRPPNASQRLTAASRSLHFAVHFAMLERHDGSAATQSTTRNICWYVVLVRGVGTWRCGYRVYIGAHD